MSRDRPALLSRAAIIAVGSEMLGTTRIDSNSLYLTEHLNRIGIDVVSKAVVGDDRPQCAHVVRSLAGTVDLLVLCGGLGPTDDDITRDVVAEVFERPQAEDARIVEHLRARYKARGYRGEMPRNNLRQAMVPRGADVLPNPHGSAPGLWLEAGARVVILLPGPPREMKPMFAALVEERLRPRTDGAGVFRSVLKVTGTIESQMDQQLQPLYGAWSARTPPVAATILAALGQIELHLAVRHLSEREARRLLAAATAEVVEVLGHDVFSTGGESLEAVVGALLAERRLTIAAAESCTGGLLTSRLTDVPGSSQYVREAVVAYANDVKVRALGVPADLIDRLGAVSEAVAEAMADGIRTRSNADVGVGITGIAGPGGGSPEKPVGTVAVAVATTAERRVRLFRFHGEREQVKFQASQAGLDMVRRVLMGVPSSPGSLPATLSPETLSSKTLSSADQNRAGAT
jgi:nicotinamide-nucleotide amidase